jgi:hypothetical protein
LSVSLAPIIAIPTPYFKRLDGHSPFTPYVAIFQVAVANVVAPKSNFQIIGFSHSLLAPRLALPQGTETAADLGRHARMLAVQIPMRAFQLRYFCYNHFGRITAVQITPDSRFSPEVVESQ